MDDPALAVVPTSERSHDWNGVGDGEVQDEEDWDEDVVEE